MSYDNLSSVSQNIWEGGGYDENLKLVLLWAQLTKIYPPIPTSAQSISITKTLLIVPTKNERDPPLLPGYKIVSLD
jgi:hypothetical protein